MVNNGMVISLWRHVRVIMEYAQRASNPRSVCQTHTTSIIAYRLVSLRSYWKYYFFAHFVRFVSVILIQLLITMGNKSSKVAPYPADSASRAPNQGCFRCFFRKRNNRVSNYIMHTITIA